MPAQRAGPGGAARGRTRLVEARSPQEWDSVLAEAVGVTPFHRWSWLQGQAALQGWRFVPLLVREGDAVAGAVPLLLRRRGPFWVSAAAPFLYAGPVLVAGSLPAALGALRRWARAHRVLVTRLDFVPDVTPEVRAELAMAGCDVEEPDTYVLDLSGGVEGVRSALHSSVRKSLRVAERSGVRVTAATEQDVVGLLPALMEESYAVRGGGSPYPPDIGRWAWQHLSGVDAIARTAHLDDGRPVGLLVALGRGTCLYLWAGGAFREFRHLRVSHALHVNLFEEAVGQGYDRVDLMGDVDAGVAQFKARLGASRAPFILAQQSTYRSYSALRALWRSRRSDGPSASADVG